MCLCVCIGRSGSLTRRPALARVASGAAYEPARGDAVENLRDGWGVVQVRDTVQGHGHPGAEIYADMYKMCVCRDVCIQTHTCMLCVGAEVG